MQLQLQSNMPQLTTTTVW